MAIGRTNAGGAGGAALNFKVVPGLTQPGTAAENTIWVKTESLTGWIIDANQPEELTEGMVWISVGTSSAAEFNALRKNGIQVYPLSAKQMMSGVLVDVTAMSYQGGEWVDWVTYLIKGSELNTEYAGAWNQTTGNHGVGGSAQMTSEGLLITGNQPTSQIGTAFRYGPDDKINFNGVGAIEFMVNIKSGSGNLAAFVTPVFETAWSSEDVASINIAISQTNQISTMDVSGVNGKYYLRVGTNSPANSAAYSYVINSLTLKWGGVNENDLY